MGACNDTAVNGINDGYHVSARGEWAAEGNVDDIIWASSRYLTQSTAL